MFHELREKVNELSENFNKKLGNKQTKKELENIKKEPGNQQRSR